MRKGPFEVPYPWCESINHSRRYRNGWFDAFEHGEQVIAPMHYGTSNTVGRDAYVAGFDAGFKHYLRTAKPAPMSAVEIVPTVVDKEPVLPPPRAGDPFVPYLPF